VVIIGARLLTMALLGAAFLVAMLLGYDPERF
jgi:hypothetical protein